MSRRRTETDSSWLCLDCVNASHLGAGISSSTGDRCHRLRPTPCKECEIGKLYRVTGGEARLLGLALADVYGTRAKNGLCHAKARARWSEVYQPANSALP